MPTNVGEHQLSTYFLNSIEKQQQEDLSQVVPLGICPWLSPK